MLIILFTFKDVTKLASDATVARAQGYFRQRPWSCSTRALGAYMVKCKGAEKTFTANLLKCRKIMEMSISKASVLVLYAITASMFYRTHSMFT